MIKLTQDKYFKRPKSRFHRLIIGVLVLLLVISVIILVFLVKAIFSSNVLVGGGEIAYINVHTGSDFDDLKQLLYNKGLIKNRWTFEWLATQQGLSKSVKPGRYKLRKGMSNFELVRILAGGRQEPVRVVINSVRTKEQLAHKISSQIEADSVELLKLLNNSEFLGCFGVKPETAFLLIIPNTYELWWNTSARTFITRMASESEKFWNSERKQKATQIGLTRAEVVTLASIIEQETNQNDEKPRIAGVYINRLKKGWPLQADPTLKFAHGDWSIRRITGYHMLIDSPYNTYKYSGLPPGPICLPSISSIDAVLNYERHNYLFFCARDDLSGYHVFSNTYEQHMQNAARYQRALNRRGIY